MRKLLVVLALFTLFSCSKGNYSPTAPTTFPSQLGGMVHNGASNGPAVEGATVKLQGQTNVTAADGSFAFLGLTSGNTTVTITKAGFQDKTIQVDLAPGQNNHFEWFITPNP